MNRLSTSFSDGFYPGEQLRLRDIKLTSLGLSSTFFMCAGIKKPKNNRYRSLKGVDPKVLKVRIRPG